LIRSQLKDALGRGFNVFHRTVFERSNGRLMGKLIGMPVVLLETTGRKTGKKRQSMLTSPLLLDDERFVLVASWGGDDRHPKWYLNLRANPEVRVTRNGRKRQMRARPATSEERAELWPKVTSRFKNYGGYQTKTDREIPLVIVEP
jgi:deazaflavin-dependent oxidoreductase (nitroreductase family)